jgi:hypothetical protein
MAIVNRKYGYIYLAEPHTGSRACAKALLQHEGSEQVGHHEYIDIPGLVSFSVVRHPLDIIVTYFHHDKRSFFEVVLAHVKRSHDSIFYYFAWQTNRVLRYENGLAKEVNEFLRSIDAPPVDFEIIKPTPNKQFWWTYFDDTTIRIIEVLLPELSKYGYTTELYWEKK